MTAISSSEHAVSPLLSDRLTDAIAQLRVRVETQGARQVRLHALYRDWNRECSTNSHAMHRQLHALESLLRAWMPRGAAAHQLSIMDGSESN